ncbi:hypothetical protein TNCT_394131 [Trichonephila clavata]|uniref:Uncharacterized protein n=1 Tax=Trichonephila clavata TaxID=2740835 RepID=A0A8X6JC75_TRICU|nr:hypothetical protein TNCT_394131 [Trichonephila clavata]
MKSTFIILIPPLPPDGTAFLGSIRLLPGEGGWIPLFLSGSAGDECRKKRYPNLSGGHTTWGRTEQSRGPFLGMRAPFSRALAGMGPALVMVVVLLLLVMGDADEVLKKDMRLKTGAFARRMVKFSRALRIAQRRKKRDGRCALYLVTVNVNEGSFCVDVNWIIE